MYTTAQGGDALLLSAVDDNESLKSSDSGGSGGGGDPLRRTPSIYMSPMLQTMLNKVQPGSIKASVFTLVTAVVGAGILSLPMAMKLAGFATGAALMLVCALLAFFSIKMLVSCSDSVPEGGVSYRGLALKAAPGAAGRRLAIFAQICLLLNLYGTTVSYVRKKRAA